MCRAPAQHRNSGSTCWPFHCEQSCSTPSCMPSAVPRTCYAARVIASRCRHAAVSLHPSWPEWKLPFRLSPIPPRACLPQRKTRPCRLRIRNDDYHRPYSTHHLRTPTNSCGLRCLHDPWISSTFAKHLKRSIRTSPTSHAGSDGFAVKECCKARWTGSVAMERGC